MYRERKYRMVRGNHADIACMKQTHDHLLVAGKPIYIYGRRGFYIK